MGRKILEMTHATYLHTCGLVEAGNDGGEGRVLDNFQK